MSVVRKIISIINTYLYATRNQVYWPRKLYAVDVGRQFERTTPNPDPYKFHLLLVARFLFEAGFKMIKMNIL